MAAHDGDDPNGNEVEPDAVGRGWVTPPGGAKVEALFVLAGSSLGIGRTERVAAPVWLSLDDLVNLDALGDPVDGLLEVEISMTDGTVIGAGWPEPFCDAVVTVLRGQAAAPPASSVVPAASPDDADLVSVGTDSSVDVDVQVAADLDVAADVDSDDRPLDLDPADPDAGDGTTDLIDAEGDVGASTGGPDVRFDEVVPTDLERASDPVIAAAAHTLPPEPSTGVFSAQPVVRNRRRNEQAADRGATGAATFGVGPSDGDDTPVTSTMASSNPASSDTASSTTPSPTTPSSTGPSDAVAPDDASPGAAGSAPSAAGRTGALELEDVVYLGGFPGQTRKRKKCTAVLTRDGLEVAGPGDLQFRIAWDTVKTVEAQNSDEARFRMNTKIHRDSSALVVECEQGVTVLLEARDCPTIPLRSAIGQLLVDLPVVVV